MRENLMSICQVKWKRKTANRHTHKKNSLRYRKKARWFTLSRSKYTIELYESQTTHPESVQAIVSFRKKTVAS